MSLLKYLWHFHMHDSIWSSWPPCGWGRGDSVSTLEITQLSWRKWRSFVPVTQHSSTLRFIRSSQTPRIHTSTWSWCLCVTATHIWPETFLLSVRLPLHLRTHQLFPSLGGLFSPVPHDKSLLKCSWMPLNSYSPPSRYHAKNLIRAGWRHVITQSVHSNDGAWLGQWGAGKGTYL